MVSQNVAIISFSALLQVISVFGHGAMVIPFSWHDSEGIGLAAPGFGYEIGCYPVEGSQSQSNHKNYCADHWFTNDTRIIGEQTITDDLLYDVQDKGTKHPWLSPGTAMSYSPCGAHGGNPLGCQQMPNEVYGDCCGGVQCSGFAFGHNAEEFEYPQAKSTLWARGSVQDVAWHVAANHMGGYSYRLCKIPEEGRAGLTEECFQKTPLDFHGDYQWIRQTSHSEFVQTKAVRTRVGTFPEGSQWTKVDKTSYFLGWFMDQVEVPQNIEAGEYVLSFRWDCEMSAQIWNVCANIDIV